MQFQMLLLMFDMERNLAVFMKEFTTFTRHYSLMKAICFFNIIHHFSDRFNIQKQQKLFLNKMVFYGHVICIILTFYTFFMYNMLYEDLKGKVSYFKCDKQYVVMSF